MSRVDLPATLFKPASWLILMVVLGLGLGTVQFVPFVELVQHNFREGAASLADVLSWSYPPRRIIAFVAPNFFGNPSHHAYFDLFNWQVEPVTVNALDEPISKINWGIKNYVEGGAYLGILPLWLGRCSLNGGSGSSELQLSPARAAVSPGRLRPRRNS